MTDVAIRVENLSKQYRIGQREVYRTLRDTLTDGLRALCICECELRISKCGSQGEVGEKIPWTRLNWRDAPKALRYGLFGLLLGCPRRR